MSGVALSRRLAAEALGTMLLVAAVVGSGIMADRLTQDTAVALLCNTAATGAMLFVLITLLGPLSGAHFNPVVTLVLALRRSLPAREAVRYAAAQCLGGIGGTLVAHAMFSLPLVQLSATVRSGPALWLSEGVATAGLIFTILAGLRFRAEAVAGLVALYIVAAYWFTASTAFANPAVAVARALTDSFSGIRPADLPGFVLAEILGALLALAFSGWLLAEGRPEPTSRQKESAA